MLRFTDIDEAEGSRHALVAGVDDAHCATVEAQETANQQLYECALSLQLAGSDIDAMVKYEELLSQELLAGAEAVSDITAQRQPSLHLKYLALKNLSELEEGAGKHESALARLIEAVALQESNALLWQRLGTLASRTGRTGLARLALEQAVACGPHHQLATLRLQQLLTQLGDSAALRQLYDASLCRLPHLAPHLALRLPKLRGAEHLAALVDQPENDSAEEGAEGVADGTMGAADPEGGTRGDSATESDPPCKRQRTGRSSIPPLQVASHANLAYACLATAGRKSATSHVCIRDVCIRDVCIYPPPSSRGAAQVTLRSITFAAIAEALCEVKAGLSSSAPYRASADSCGTGTADGANHMPSDSTNACVRLGRPLRLLLPSSQATIIQVRRHLDTEPLSHACVASTRTCHIHSPQHTHAMRAHHMHRHKEAKLVHTPHRQPRPRISPTLRSIAR